MVGRLRVFTRADLVMGFAVMVIWLGGCGADPATKIAQTETDTLGAFDSQAPDANDSTDVVDAGVIEVRDVLNITLGHRWWLLFSSLGYFGKRPRPQAVRASLVETFCNYSSLRYLPQKFDVSTVKI